MTADLHFRGRYAGLWHYTAITVIPFEFGAVASSNVTRGLRPYGSQEILIKDLQAYQRVCDQYGIKLGFDRRKASIKEQVKLLASEVGGVVPSDQQLLDEVTNLVEAPTAFRGAFDKAYLELPRDVLVTVMRKHQRYFAVEDKDGNLMPYFIGVRNGDSEHLDKVINGNEQVIRARFSDANFFYQTDVKTPLRDFLPRLETLTFQAALGSMRQKNDRVASTIDNLGEVAGLRPAGYRHRKSSGRHRQGGSGDEHGRRDDLAAGHHGS